MNPRPRLLVLALLSSFGSSCVADSRAQVAGTGAGAVDIVDASPLEGGLGSLDEVARAVVEGLNTNKAQSLRQLLLSEADFTGRLFDVLSNHPNARQMGPGLIFAMQGRQSEDDLARALERFGGRGLRLLAVEPGVIETAKGATLYRRPLLRVEDARGEPLALELLGTVIEHTPSHTFKLLGYRLRE